MRTIGVGAKIAISLLALTSFSILLSNYSVFAEESSVSTATVTINQSCSMSGTTNTAHTANLANGTYSGSSYPNGIGQTTLKVFCNDNAGFAIYAIGYTGNEYGNTKLHNDTLGSNYDISTGKYTSGTTVNSTWSMKLASVAGTYAATIANGTNNTENFTTWHEVPDEYTKVAYRDSGTDIEINGSGTGSSITVTYDSYISAGQPAGSYVGKVKYTLVHPSTAETPAYPLNPLAASDCPAYSICYAPNYSDVDGDMSSLGEIAASDKAGAQTKDNNTAGGGSDITSNTTLVSLIAPNYKRDGYGFAGWSTDLIATNSSIIFGPNETISVDSSNGGIDISGGLILYPVWIGSFGNLQGWTGCPSLSPAVYDSENGKISASLNDIIALTDTRDGNVYTVAKLADGNCWMVENLRLDAEHTRSVADIAKAQGYGSSETFGNFIGLADPEYPNYYGTYNSIYSMDGSTMIDIGSNYEADNRMPRYINNNTNMVTGATAPDGTTLLIDNYYSNNNYYRWYSYGNFYTWAAAIANTKYYTNYYNSNNNDEKYNSDSAGTSICPTGWRIPLGYHSYGVLSQGSSDIRNRVGSFSYLDKMMGGSGDNSSTNTTSGDSNAFLWRSFPNNFVRSGYSGSTSRGHNGGYWTSSAASGANAYIFELLYSYIYFTETSNKHTDHAIRCISVSGV